MAGGNFVITKVTFSSDPTNPSCDVMVFLQRAQAIFYCRVEDPCWTQVVGPPSPREAPADAAYHNGAFFLLRTHGIFVYDLSRSKVQGMLLFEPELQGVSKYFLVGTSGLHLVAVRFVEEEEEEEEEVAAVAGDVNYVRSRKHMVETYHISDDLKMRQVSNDQSNITIFYGDRMHYLALCADDWDSSIVGGSMYMEYKSSPVDDGHANFGIFYCKLEDGKPQPVMLGIGEAPRFGLHLQLCGFRLALFKLFYIS